MASQQTQQQAIEAFIDLANQMKEQGSSIQFVSTALMRACALYSTYVIVGNDGGLHDSGIDKLKELFASELAHVQSAKLSERGLTEAPQNSAAE